MWDLLWLLLPVAAASGWYAARRSRPAAAGPRFNLDYVEGLNYLINEQPDKAIEVFTRMIEVDSETVEVHVALGNLFRRRGEVDRAIRIHQNLIARPTLTRDQRAMALLELGEDYLRAGLLDRAEGLFKELTEANLHTEPALRHLVDIYEQEKEWNQAIEAAHRLEAVSGRPMGSTIAHYHCELAEAAHRARSLEPALRTVKRALQQDRECVRASILQGRIEMDTGQYRAASRSFMRVDEQDADYLSEVLAPLDECFRRLGRSGAMADYLREVLARHVNVPAMLTMADQLTQQRGGEEAADFLAGHLARQPSLLGIERLMQLYHARAQGQCRYDLQVLAERMERLFQDVPAYFCTHCGFSGKVLHWQCPGCRKWSTVKPLHGMTVDTFLSSALMQSKNTDAQTN